MTLFVRLSLMLFCVLSLAVVGGCVTKTQEGPYPDDAYERAREAAEIIDAERMELNAAGMTVL